MGTCCCMRYNMRCILFESETLRWRNHGTAAAPSCFIDVGRCFMLMDLSDLSPIGIEYIDLRLKMTGLLWITGLHQSFCFAGFAASQTNAGAIVLPESSGIKHQLFEKKLARNEQKKPFKYVVSCNLAWAGGFISFHPSHPFFSLHLIRGALSAFRKWHVAVRRHHAKKWSVAKFCVRMCQWMSWVLMICIDSWWIVHVETEATWFPRLRKAFETFWC